MLRRVPPFEACEGATGFSPWGSTPEHCAGPILPIVHYDYVLENGGAVLERLSKELMENPDVKSAYFGL